MNWVFPRARLAFYERLGEDTFQEISTWLGIDWNETSKIPFMPRDRRDWSLRRPELFREVAALAQLEHIYEELLSATEPDRFFVGRDGPHFQPNAVYDLVNPKFFFYGSGNLL
ncbi:MAG TPA: hypothetical protein PLP42_20295 [Acidobacteriota bacterium]|nr:hypothetical protein [Acidobacteriota bacterium]HRR55418.1 hypothetical protein [Acidobacteriota bacterium]HRV07356.1 hypothetical protein [Acidobacteriota bacterium]HXK62234.1 hypothetical protein [Acidobacteriota bacterium]